MASTDSYSPQELRLLRLLSRRYPNVTAAHTEMINLNAILALPKGTDHYISDIHGAYEQFDHILRHASGAIQRKINQTFGETMSEHSKVDLAMLIYYPEKKLRQLLPLQENPSEWMAQTIAELVRVARASAQKYTRSKVRKRLAQSQAYILEELLTEIDAETGQRERYLNTIIRSIVDLDEGQAFIIGLAYLIQSLVVDRLYILGDIFDRGPGADKVIDRLMRHHDVTIQWGNHDVSWMGAAAGCEALMANVIRLAMRYATLETLHDAYGIQLHALDRLAQQVYGDDPCEEFQPKADQLSDDYTAEQVARMHKAIAIIQFKLEAQVIRRHPEYAMDDRLVLDAVDYAEGTIRLYGERYPLLDRNFPTINPHDTAALTPEEAAVVADLTARFQSSARLQSHIRYLYSYGNMFQVRDGNLRFHGCIPVDEQGEFVAFPLAGELLAGPSLLARFEQACREAYLSSDAAVRQDAQDAMWYLWCGQYSPLYGRSRMTTFERYFITDKITHEEPRGPYYRLRDSKTFCTKLLAAFGADPKHGIIINGHMPVKVKKGERPIMGGGKLIVIDGGMSEPYQKQTGIAGYTLISSSHEVWLAAHDAYITVDEMVARDIDVTPHAELIQTFPERVMIADTDTGAELRGQLEDLQKLVEAYRRGVLVEKV